MTIGLPTVSTWRSAYRGDEGDLFRGYSRAHEAVARSPFVRCIPDGPTIIATIASIAVGPIVTRRLTRTECPAGPTSIRLRGGTARWRDSKAGSPKSRGRL